MNWVSKHVKTIVLSYVIRSYSIYHIIHSVIMQLSIKINQYSVFVPTQNALQTTVSAGSDKRWYRMIHEWVVKSACWCFELSIWHTAWDAQLGLPSCKNAWAGGRRHQVCSNSAHSRRLMCYRFLPSTVQLLEFTILSIWQAWRGKLSASLLLQPLFLTLDSWPVKSLFIAWKVESRNCWPGHTKHTLWRRLPQTLHTPTLRPNAGPAMAQVQIGRLRVPLQV